MWKTRNAMTYLHTAMVNLFMPIRQSSSNEEENDENGIWRLNSNRDEGGDILAYQFDRLDVITTKPTTTITNF